MTTTGDNEKKSRLQSIAEDTFELIDEMTWIGRIGEVSIKRREIVMKRIKELHDKYPSAGWAVEGDKLRLHWQEMDRIASEREEAQTEGDPEDSS